MNSTAVSKLLQTLPLAKKPCRKWQGSGKSVVSVASDIERNSTKELTQGASNSNVYLDAVLVDVMSRYGTFSFNDLLSCEENTENQAQDDRKELQRADPPTQQGLPGSRDLPLGPPCVISQMEASLREAMQVRLLIRSARGVSGVDLLGGGDLLCAAFVGDWSNGTGSATCAGNQIFQTEIRSGYTEADWTWNEVRIHRSA